MARQQLTEVELYALGEFVWLLWLLHGEGLRINTMGSILFKTYFDHREPCEEELLISQRLMRQGIQFLKNKGEEFSPLEVIFKDRGPLKISGPKKLIFKILEPNDDWDLDHAREELLHKALEEAGLLTDAKETVG